MPGGGALRYKLDRLALVGEPEIPAGGVSGQVVVEYPGADLEQQVGTAQSPAHLLLLTMRLDTTWLMVDSTNAVEMVLPQRRRSP